MIETKFSVTLDEYLEAQDIFTREQNRKARWWRIPAYCVFCTGFILLLVTAPRPFSFDTLPPAVFAMFVVCFMPVWIKPIQRMNFKKRFRVEKPNLTNMSVSVDAAGYHVTIPGVGAGLAEWAGVTSWSEGKTVFVIKSGLLMRLLPKSALNADQITELRSLLNSHIGPENISRLGVVK